jgi:hypothetical protein
MVGEDLSDAIMRATIHSIPEGGQRCGGSVKSSLPCYDMLCMLSPRRAAVDKPGSDGARRNRENSNQQR